MKVIFTYTHTYNEIMAEMSRKELKGRDVKDTLSLKKAFEKSWKRKEKKVLSSIEKNSRLKFPNENIKCYFINHMKYKAFSNPLTIRIGGSIEDIETTLIHELIHNLLEFNEKKISRLMEKIYTEEGRTFRNHIPLLLIEKGVIEDIY